MNPDARPSRPSTFRPGELPPPARTPRGRRILILVENLPVPLDRRVWMEATTLAAAGHTVSVICPMGRGWERAEETIDGVAIYRYPPPPEAHAGLAAYAREYAHALRQMLLLAARVRRERGFDVIHGCNPPDLLFLIAWRYRHRGVHYVFDHHDLSPELYEAKFGRRGWVHRMLRLLERLNFATARVSIATNESFRAIARDRGGKRGSDVFTVRSGPALDDFRPGPGDRSLRRGAAHVLGYVGVIGQQEGMDLLVAAVSSLIHRHAITDLHVVIAGFGPALGAMRADVARRGLERHFTFTGALYGERLVAALNACDIGLSPDPKNAMTDRSTMNKIVEYMALEKPVVLFDLVEGRASAGEAGLYARPDDPEDFADCIAVLLHDRDRARAMGAIGRRRVETTLSWAHSRPALLAAYERVFEQP